MAKPIKDAQILEWERQIKEWGNYEMERIDKIIKEVVTATGQSLDNVVKQWRQADGNTVIRRFGETDQELRNRICVDHIHSAFQIQLLQGLSRGILVGDYGETDPPALCYNCRHFPFLTGVCAPGNREGLTRNTLVSGCLKFRNACGPPQDADDGHRPPRDRW